MTRAAGEAQTAAAVAPPPPPPPRAAQEFEESDEVEVEEDLVGQVANIAKRERFAINKSYSVEVCSFTFMHNKIYLNSL